MAFDNVKNYYKHLVFEEINQQIEDNRDDNYVSDIACVALNHLPPRYFRHDVDMAFYLSPADKQEAVEKVRLAVERAIAFINSSDR